MQEVPGPPTQKNQGKKKRRRSSSNNNNNSSNTSSNNSIGARALEHPMHIKIEHLHLTVNMAGPGATSDPIPATLDPIPVAGAARSQSDLQKVLAELKILKDRKALDAELGQSIFKEPAPPPL